MKIIGITGAFGSGKSTAADFFEGNGFKKIILSNFLEEEARKRGVEIIRKVLQDMGNEWREKQGASVLADKVIEQILKQKLEKVVIDGIRNVGEIKKLQNFGNFTLISIVSSRKNRFERLKKLKRREALIWELFEKLDSRDAGIGEKETGLHVDECIKLADISIENNGREEEYVEKLKNLLSKL